MKELDWIIKILDFEGGIEIIGSADDQRIKYPSDIDLQEYVETKLSKSYINYLLVKKLKALKLKSGVYVTDIKAGIYNGTPVKWTYAEFESGKKCLSTLYPEGGCSIEIKLEDVLSQKSIIKFDIGIEDSNSLIHEISINYYFSFAGGDKTYTRFTKKDLVKSFKYDIQNLSEKNKWKALKRLYALSKIDPKALTLQFGKYTEKELLEIINSPLAYAYQQISRMKFLVEVLRNKAQFKRIEKGVFWKNFKNIINNLKQVKKPYLLDSVDGDEVFSEKTLKVLFKNEELADDLSSICDEMNEVLNNILEKKL